MKKSLAIVSLVTLFTFSSTMLAFAAPKWTGAKINGKANFKVEQMAKGKSKNKIEAKQEKAFKGNVKVNGNVVKFDVSPVDKGGRVLIPLRAVSASLGADVEYNETAKTVTVVKDGKVVEITMVNQVVIKIDGKVYESFDVPPQMISNRTFVPLRFLAEIFGLKVNYDDGDVVIDKEAKALPFSWYNGNGQYSSESREVSGTWRRDNYFADMDFAVITSGDQTVSRPPLPMANYNEYLVLWAYLGESPSSGHDIKITKVEQLQDKVWVKVQTVSPGQDQTVLMVLTYPTDAVQIKKADLTQKGSLTFIFVDQNGKVLEEIKTTVN